MANVIPAGTDGYESAGGSQSVSEYFTGYNFGSCAWTANTTTDPRGTSLADQQEMNATTPGTRWMAHEAPSPLTTSTDYYFSIFAKHDGSSNWDTLALTFYGDNKSPQEEGYFFDLTDGSIALGSWNAPLDQGIVPYGSGWYRCWIKSASDPTNTFGTFGCNICLGTDSTITGVVGEGPYLWGAFVDTVNYTDWTTLPYLVGAEEYFHSTGFNTHTFTEPAGAQEDDFFLVQMNARDVSGVHTITEPGDFTVLDEFYETTGSADDLQYIAYKVRGATAGSGYAFSLDTNDSCGYTMSVWRNVDTSNPFDVSYVKGTHYSAVTDAVNTAAPDITTNTDNAMVVLLYGGTQAHSADQAGNPSGYNEACRSAMNVDSKNVAVQYKLVTSAGTENPGAFTFATGTTTTDRRAFTLALSPLPTAGLKAQWDVNTRGRADDDFYEHINGTLETSTGSPTKDETYAFDGLTFNGTSQYTKISTLPVGLSSTFPDSDFTMAVQCKPSEISPTDYMSIFGAYLSTSNVTRVHILADISSAEALGAIVAQDSGAGEFTNSNDVIDDQDRHVVVYRRETDVVTLWLDGTKEASVNATVSDVGTVDTIGFAGKTDLSISDAQSWYFAGTIYWAAIYDEAISDGAVVALGETSNPFVTAVSASVVEHIAPAYHRRVNPLVRM